jgi:hypothetical protein
LSQNQIVCALWIQQVCEHAVSTKVFNKKKKKSSTTKESKKDNGGWQCLHIHDMLVDLRFCFNSL